jgi:hypothetical protein
MKTQIVDLEHALNILSSAAEEIGISAVERVAEAFCVAPHGEVDLDRARRLKNRAAALSELLLEVQEEWMDVLALAAERAEDRTGLSFSVDPERYEWVDSVCALGEETLPVVGADGKLLARLGTCPAGWVVVETRGGSPSMLFAGKVWTSSAEAESAVREKFGR